MVSVFLRSRPDGSGFDLTEATPGAFDKKIAHIRECAGDHFASIEINVLLQHLGGIETSEARSLIAAMRLSVISSCASAWASTAARRRSPRRATSEETSHLGARICAAAWGGQILLSPTTAAPVFTISDDISVRSLGAHALKGAEGAGRLVGAVRGEGSPAPCVQGCSARARCPRLAAYSALVGVLKATFDRTITPPWALAATAMVPRMRGANPPNIFFSVKWGSLSTISHANCEIFVVRHRNNVT